MQQSDLREREIQSLRDRLSRLSEASLRISESLDVETVLQEVLDNARSLTGARYAVIVTFDASDAVQTVMASGLTDEESATLDHLPGGHRFLDHFRELTEPLHVEDFAGYVETAGLTDFRPPNPIQSLLVAPIRRHGHCTGAIYLSKTQADGDFHRDDREMLGMFSSQAALVIANAHHHEQETYVRSNLETLIDTSPIGVAVVDAGTGMPVLLNRETRRILGLLHVPASEIDPQFGVPRLDLLTFRRADGREFSVEENPLIEELRTGETVRAEEILIESEGGRSVSALVNGTPNRSESGEVETVIFTLQDMAPIRELERLRVELLGTVSHELRGPLTSIKGAVVSLRESLDSLSTAETLQFISIIESQSDQMRELIGELLDVARIETGTLSVKLGPTEITSVVEEAQVSFLNAFAGRDITIDMEPDLPFVMADHRRVVQVIGNLLTNAAQHSEQASPIRLSCTREDSYVAISVRDEGQGLQSDKLNSLFQRFSHLHDEPRRSETNGAGLGLWISKGIVEAHGGRIWAESRGLGFGSTFTFLLPEAEVVGRPGRVRAGKRRLDTITQERILVVDDDPMTLRYVRDILTKARYKTLAASDPDEALKLFRSERPQLALLDLTLPGTDGINLMERMLRIEQVPVVLISSYDRDEMVVKALEAGAIDYITKPFSSSELVARIRASMLRRLPVYPHKPTEPFVLGELTLNYATRTVTLADTPLEMTPTEYELLREFSLNVGRVLTFDYLLDRVWGQKRHGNKGNVRTYVKRLRRKLGEPADRPRYIFAQPGVGYRLGDPELADT